MRRAGMAEDLIGYQRLIERALRGVLRDTLTGVAQNGLPGRHHLYINFRTDHPGVVIADSLRARYPSEMTIVLQFEFWDLEVEDDGFGVTLSFGNVPHRLWVPFAAVRLFTDPAAEFGLQFNVAERAEGPVMAAAKADSGAVEPEPEQPPEEAPGEKVVSLDRFRSK
jgi:uncharacterized protein